MIQKTIQLTDTPKQRGPGLPDPYCTHPDVERAWRQKLIRDAAYFRSLKRQPASGKEVEDWLAAEEEINRSFENRS